MVKWIITSTADQEVVSCTLLLLEVEQLQMQVKNETSSPYIPTILQPLLMSFNLYLPSLGGYHLLGPKIMQFLSKTSI